MVAWVFSGTRREEKLIFDVTMESGEVLRPLNQSEHDFLQQGIKEGEVGIDQSEG